MNHCLLYSLGFPSHLPLDLLHGHLHLPSLLHRLALRGPQRWAAVSVLLTKLRHSNIDIWPTWPVYRWFDGFTLQVKMVILQVVCSLVFIDTIYSWLSRC